MLDIEFRCSKRFFFPILLLPFTCFAHVDWRDVGDTLQIALPTTALATSALKHDAQGLWQFTESFSTTMGTTIATKYAVQRERPNGSTRSFPSGHTATTFSAATFLQQRYGAWYGIPAYSLATLTGFSRVKSHQHWTSDVIAGAAIAVGATFFFTSPYPARITPIVEKETQGVQIEIDF